MAKILPHDGLEVGRVVVPRGDDPDAYKTQHGCRCNCGKPGGCHDRVWRVGDPDKCAVCAADKEKKA